MYGKKVATSGDWHGSLIPAIQAGVVMMATSTALHQSIKIPLSEMVMSPLASKVGPGKKFSI